MTDIYKDPPHQDPIEGGGEEGLWERQEKRQNLKRQIHVDMKTWKKIRQFNDADLVFNLNSSICCSFLLLPLSLLSLYAPLLWALWWCAHTSEGSFLPFRLSLVAEKILHKENESCGFRYFGLLGKSLLEVGLSIYFPYLILRSGNRMNTDLRFESSPFFLIPSFLSTLTEDDWHFEI